MKEHDTERISLPVVGDSTGGEEEVVDIKLTEIQPGLEVRAVHRRGDSRLESHSFKVVDKSWKKCAYRSGDEPPVEVVQAVEKYGYHVVDAGSRIMESVDLQHLYRVFELVSGIHSSSSDPFLQGFLSHARHSLAAALLNLDLRRSVVENRGREAFEELMVEAWNRIGSESDQEITSMKTTEIHNHFAQAATEGGYVSERVSDVEDLQAAVEIVSSSEFPNQSAPESTVSLDTNKMDGNHKLLATIFDENHVNRYTFDVINQDENTCVVQGDDGNGRPPMEVIEEVREIGYGIENLHIPQSNSPEWQQLVDSGNLMDTIAQSYETGNMPYEHLDRAKSAIEDAAIVAMILNIMEPKDHRRVLAQSIKISRLVKSINKLASFPSLSILDDLLWNHYFDCLPPSVKCSLGEKYEKPF